jgi:hypothetical protein
MVHRTRRIAAAMRAWLVGLTLLWAGAATAAEATRVLSTRSLKDRDFDIQIAWQHDATRAAIKREYVDATSSLLVNDLVYRQSRDSLRLRGEVGLVQDLSFVLSGALVLADQRGLDFDKAGDCASQTCVETLLRDGFLPGAQATSWGLDAENGRPYAAPSQHVFGGPKRSGLEYLGLGLRWAVTNELRDRTRPTWILGLESRLSVGTDQRFDPGNPTGNRGVGAGYHQLIASTTFSRRFGAADPYVGAWFMQPMLTSSSVFKGLSSSPQRRLGGQAGIEGTVWEDPGLRARFVLEASARLEYRFAGLAQSPLWEVLSGDSRCATDATRCRPGIDVDGAGKAVPHAGVLRSPGYGLFGADVGMMGQFGGHARLRGLFGMSFEETHLLSDTSSGNVVYDIPGRRFQATRIYDWHVIVEGAATF